MSDILSSNHPSIRKIDDGTMNDRISSYAPPGSHAVIDEAKELELVNEQ